ncbi:hypothetical protein DN392_26710 [Bacillus sp. BB51/4]|nr:hypothetical protein DN392_26710 [Bacillus sp. BB51/4]
MLWLYNVNLLIAFIKLNDLAIMKALISNIIVCNRMSHSICKTRSGKNIKEDLQKHGALLKCWEIIEPSQSSPKIDKRIC